MSTLTPNNTSLLKEKMDQLYRFISEKENITKPQETVLFLSLGNLEQRATVLHTSADSFSTAWKKLYKHASTYIKGQKSELSYLKIDIVTNIQQLSPVEFIKKLSRTKRYYFRYGVSFDSEFKYAFLEQELNANAVLKFDKKNNRAFIDEKNLQLYIKKHRPTLTPLDFSKVTNLHIFQTKGYFLDHDQCYELHTDERNNGRRNTELTKEELTSMIKGSQDYLTRLGRPNGKFIYGYFSCFDREIEHYNTLRHCSTLYAMCESYEFLPNPELKIVIERGIHYLIEEFIATNDDTKEAFLLENIPGGFEIKLGGNSAAILALTKYTTVFDNELYIETAKMLANGIKRMQNKDGSFFHILDFPSLQKKEEYRTIYYDGEAAFSLMRLYSLTKNDDYLQMVKQAFNHFIANDYWKNHDHWLSYCTNELTIYCPEEKYYQFGLQNVEGRLDYIYQRITTYPTFLELTVAAYRMVERMKQTGASHLLEHFDEDKLVKTIHKRAEYQRNGYFYPETAMYHKQPSRIIGAFFIRHHTFRTRIDDVEHNLSGYIEYYNNLR
ncbi:hypothetical protein [Gracilibacillus alcaliphilus]|uniref:hypothetical protein n=1 Tax=Gracilibacillus alcaliphilus TaxID=1401441 RepID=UPI0019560E44|nr:hypothetical protein [Gracilibacillus alcaliphilus]MBM7677142.1 hypothetical protein [Gracilibacillus alcaliphilus]